MLRKQSTAKSVSIIAMSAALYASFFLLSGPVSLGNFTLLYLPIILLGVYPLWFGWDGLAGAIIGALIGGVFVESVGFLAIFEVIVAVLIYMLNWVLIPKNAAEKGKTRSLAYLLGVYAITLLAGTCYIILQYTALAYGPFQDSSITLPAIATTFLINLPFVCIICPALIRAVSPKLKAWGIYTGNFREWRNRKNKL